MVVDVMVKFEPCEYTRKMIFRSVTQACQLLIKKSSSSKWYIFTLIFTSSFLFSRLKKASGPQRIYLVVYTLLDVIVVVVVTMDLKFGWTVRCGGRQPEIKVARFGEHISHPSNLRRLHVATVRKLSAAVSREREFFIRVFVFNTSLF